MKGITITVPENGVSRGTVVRTKDGAEVGNIRRIDIAIAVDEVVTAQIEFVMPHLIGGTFVATVSEAHLRELAAAHGFDLVRTKLSDVTDLSSTAKEKATRGWPG